MRNVYLGFSLPDPKGRRAIFHRALIDSLPIFMGYETLGLVAGVLLAARGDVVLGPLWAFLTSTLWVSGTLSIACVPMIAERASVLSFVLVALAINFRYAFYGVTMLSRWKGIPLLRKLYLILMLADENYALCDACKIKNPLANARYCTYLSALNQLYWVTGLTSGAILVWCLGQIVSPEALHRWTNGMEFSMAALYLIILTDQVREKVRRKK